MNKEQLEAILNLKSKIDTDKVKLDTIVMMVETPTEIMFNEFPDIDPNWDDAQWIDMYKIFIEITSEGFNVEVCPWSWSQATILCEEPLIFNKVDPERLLKILDPDSIQDMLMESYPDMFKMEEED